METKRDSKYEVLRIISIFLIVAYHFATTFSSIKGGVLATGASLYHFFALVVGSWGQLGVDLFVLISIKFLRKGNKFKSKRFLCLILEPVFYAVFWFFVSVYIFELDVDKLELVKQMFGAFSGSHWFITAYILLYVFHPFLNRIVDSISYETLKKGTIIISVFVGMFKTVYIQAPICDFLFFINVYLIYCCIEKNSRSKEWVNQNCKKMCALSIIGLLIINSSFVLIGDLLESTTILEHSIYLNHRCSLVVFAIGLFLFYSVDNSTKRVNSRLANTIASTSLGVYLSHQGISQNVWKYLLIRDYLEGIKACGYLLGATLFICICCVLLDLIRQYCIEKPLMYFLGRIRFISISMSRIDSCINNLK